MDPLFTAVTNLGVGAFAIYIMWRMYQGSMARMKEKDAETMAAMNERELAYRALEKDVRVTVTSYLEKATDRLGDNTKTLDNAIKMMDRVARMLDMQSSLPNVQAIKIENHNEKQSE